MFPKFAAQQTKHSANLIGNGTDMQQQPVFSDGDNELSKKHAQTASKFQHLAKQSEIDKRKQVFKSQMSGKH